jgi:hypothetical protein
MRYGRFRAEALDVFAGSEQEVRGMLKPKAESLARPRCRFGYLGSHCSLQVIRFAGQGSRPPRAAP